MEVLRNAYIKFGKTIEEKEIRQEACYEFFHLQSNTGNETAWNFITTVTTGKSSHTYGVSKNGCEMFVAFQIRGGSKEGKVHYWKQFNVAKIGKLNILDESFEKPRPDYVKGDKKIKLIYCEL
jgi:hypothetical protein